MTMVIERLHHAALTVTDVARSRRFYGGILGLREIPRPDFDFDGAWYETGDGSQLHLIVHPATRTMRGTTQIDSRDSHLALRVRSFDAAVAHLRQHGVDVIEHWDNKTPWGQLYVTDPDGHVIELNVARESEAG